MRISGSDLSTSIGYRINHSGNGIHREQEIPILYKGQEIGSRRVDFLIESTILVEIKQSLVCEDVHLAQGLNYLTAYGLNTGTPHQLWNARNWNGNGYFENRKFPIIVLNQDTQDGQDIQDKRSKSRPS